jgi:hypothetical protein
MAIEVKHGVGGAALVGAFAGGRAQATDRRSARLSQLAAATAARRDAAKQAEKNREFEDEQGALARDFKDEQAGFAEDFKAREAEKERTFQKGESVLAGERASQRVYDNAYNQDLVNERQQKRGQEDEEHRFTFKQEKRREQLYEYRATIDADTTLDAADKAKAHREVARELAGMKQYPQPKELTPVEVFDSRNKPMKDGSIVSVKPDGTLDKTVSKAPPPPEETAAQKRTLDLAEKKYRLEAVQGAHEYASSIPVGGKEDKRPYKVKFDEYMEWAGLGDEPVKDADPGVAGAVDPPDPNAQQGAAAEPPDEQLWPSEVRAKQRYVIKEEGPDSFTVQGGDLNMYEIPRGTGQKIADQATAVAIRQAAGSPEQARILAKKLGYIL